MPATKLDRAKTQLICHHPFFGTILLQGGITPREDIPTACVDRHGRMFYNPQWAESLSVPELMGVLAHETLHKVCLHLLRMGDRDLRRWNIATDWWINETLLADGFTLPTGALRHPGAQDAHAEYLYTQVPIEPEAQSGDGGEGGGLSGDLDATGPPLTPDEVATVETTTKVLVAQAAQAAKSAGKLGGALADVVAGLIASKVPWWEVLSRYMHTYVRHEYSWARPNRRYAPEYYLPTPCRQPGMGTLVLTIDISGSISPEELAHYNGHLQRIVAEVRPEVLHILYTDTDVRHHTVVLPDDEVQLTHYSGGGTHMEAALNYCDAHDLDPDVWVCLTDGRTPFQRTTAPCPTVWLITTPSITAPYGTTIHP